MKRKYSDYYLQPLLAIRQTESGEEVLFSFSPPIEQSEVDDFLERERIIDSAVREVYVRFGRNRTLISYSHAFTR